MSGKAIAKSAREVAEFEKFANIMRKWIDVSSIKSQPQGYADISVKLGEELVGFELLSIVDEGIAGNTGLHNWTNLDEKLSKKLLSKNYKDNGPIELLIYSKSTFLTTEMILDESQKTLWADQSGQFRRIWFFTEDSRVFLFHKSWWSQLGLLP
jgi:hypothetical protein